MPKAKVPAKKRPTVRKPGEVKANAAPPATVTGNYETTQALSIPMVKFNAGDAYAFTIQGVRSQFLPGGNAKTSAILLRAANLDTGELADFIAPTVLVSTLTRAYGPLEGFDEKDKAGQIFESSPWDNQSVLVKCTKREGKRYMDVEVH